MTVLLGTKRSAPNVLKTLLALPNPPAEPREFSSLEVMVPVAVVHVVMDEVLILLLLVLLALSLSPALAMCRWSLQQKRLFSRKARP